PRVLLAVGLVVSLFFIVTLGIGTIRLQNIQGGDATVWVGREQSQEFERLPVGQERNYPFWTWPWGSSCIRVKAAELPAKEINLRPWWRSFGPESQQLPGSLLKPLALIGAEMWSINDSKDAEYRLTVIVNETRYEATPYNGRALLIGATDLDIPLANLPNIPGWRELLEKYRDRLMT